MSGYKGLPVRSDQSEGYWTAASRPGPLHSMSKLHQILPDGRDRGKIKPVYPTGNKVIDFNSSRARNSYLKDKLFGLLIELVF